MQQTDQNPSDLFNLWAHFQYLAMLTCWIKFDSSECSLMEKDAVDFLMRRRRLLALISLVITVLVS